MAQASERRDTQHDDTSHSFSLSLWAAQEEHLPQVSTNLKIENFPADTIHNTSMCRQVNIVMSKRERPTCNLGGHRTCCGGVIEHEGAPELAVLLTQRVRDLHYEPMVQENQLWFLPLSAKPPVPEPCTQRRASMVRTWGSGKAVPVQLSSILGIWAGHNTWSHFP